MDTNQPEQESTAVSTEENLAEDRRNFIRNAVLATGAAATIGLSNTASAATATNEFGSGKLLAASFDSKYKLDIYNLRRVVEQLVDIAGCPTCGLVGFDLRLSLDDVIDVKSEIPVNVSLENQI